jgi:hypothetical protein
MQIARETGNSFDAVKMETKRMACVQGEWPWETLANGSTWPGSERDASVEAAACWIDCCHRLAADLGIVLREVDGEPDGE